MAVDAHAVRCSSTLPLTDARLDTADLPDAVLVAEGPPAPSSLSVSVAGGDGDDRLSGASTMHGGAGADVLIGRRGAHGAAHPRAQLKLRLRVTCGGAQRFDMRWLTPPAR